METDQFTHLHLKTELMVYLYAFVPAAAHLYAMDVGATHAPAAIYEEQ